MRAVLAALAANLGIAATKLAAALITGSASMLAESVHSIADSGNQVLLIVGRRRSRRAETEEHQFSTAPNGTSTRSLSPSCCSPSARCSSLYEGWRRITHPEEVVSPLVALIVLGVAIILESFSLRTALAASNQARGGQRLSHFIRHAKRPSCPPCCLRTWQRWPGWCSRWLASR
jgi:divalent metal cation (Fe/Co/Zn/Cd) transporter